MSTDNTYGEDYYSNPVSNLEYTKTLQDFDINQFIYDAGTLGKTPTPDLQKPLVTRAYSLPFVYEGNNVITDTFISQSLSINPLQGMDTPQYFPEPGYLISFMVACNDPLFALKVFIRGIDNTGYSVADFSMQKMAALGLGMTQGEAEEIIYTDEGQSSRDVSGQPSTERPYLQRYKHLPTGTETDYDKYKGTLDDKWIVAAYNPKLYPKFNSLYFDIYNGNQSGARLVHYMEIKRLIIIQDNASKDKPQLSHNILSVDPQTVVDNIQKQSKLTKVTTPLFNKINTSMYSLDKSQQQNKELFGTVMDSNEDMFNSLMKTRFQRKTKLH